MKFYLTALALGASLGMAGPALAQEAIMGTWDTVTETPMGNFQAAITIDRGSDGYTVQIVEQAPAGAEAMPPMESTISNVVVEETVVRFTRALTTPQGPMELTYVLTTDGNSLRGEANSSFGAIPITGTRAQ